MAKEMLTNFKIPRRQVKLYTEEMGLKSPEIKANRRPSGVVRLVNVTMVDSQLF
jgi:hypothetical protein